MKSKRLVFFGNERLATGTLSQTPTINALIDEGYEIAAIVSNYKEPSGRATRELEIAAVAREHNIPLLLPNKLSEIKGQLIGFEANFAVLAAYGKIIPKSIIDIFPLGILNIHPSLLPKYRGSTPIESALLNGDALTGVSIMSLVPAMDAGPVYAQTNVNVEPNQTKQELTNVLAIAGRDLLMDVLPAIINGSLKPIAQSESLATFTKQLSKNDSQLNLSKSAAQLEREVRAFLNYPKSKIELFGNQVIITKARVAQYLDDGFLVVQCKDSYLEILELIGPSGKTMSGQDFIRGYKKS